MRLIASRVYRAFRELDSYSDEQCERFVRAAKRKKRVRVLHWFLILLTFVALTIGSAFCVAAVDRAISESRLYWSRWGSVVLVASAVGLLSVPAVSAFLLRDILLRRRIRYVLRTRGVCMDCSYSLIGLSVSPDNKVKCPECGFESNVDPALGELVRDDRGVARFEPKTPEHSAPRIFTPKRVKAIRRWSIRVAIVVGVALPTALGMYELYLRRQADQAARERPGAQGLMAHAMSAQPPDTNVNSPDAWLAFDVADATIRKNESDFKASLKGDEARASPDFSLFYVPRANESEEQRTYSDRSLELARRLLEIHRTTGVFEQLREMADLPRAVRPISYPPSQPAVGVLLPQLGRSRNIARINAARMFLAQRAGDVSEFADAMRTNLALASMNVRQALLVDALVGVGDEAITIDRICAVLITQPSVEWLNAIESTYRQTLPHADLAFSLEGERLSTMDTLGWFFSTPSNVRLGRFQGGTAMRLLAGGDAPLGRLGSYAENKRVVNDYFESAKAIATVPRSNRGAIPVATTTGYVLPDLLLPAVGNAIRAFDILELRRRGVFTMIALERFRLAHGDYPERIEALVPEFLAQMPLDPWSGRALGYRRIDRTRDPLGRAYLLYSVGEDGTDNAGNPEPPGRWPIGALGEGATPGCDYILNSDPGAAR